MLNKYHIKQDNQYLWKASLTYLSITQTLSFIPNIQFSKTYIDIRLLFIYLLTIFDLF